VELTEVGLEMVKKKHIANTVDLTELESKSSPVKPLPKASDSISSLPADVQWILDWTMEISPECCKLLVVCELFNVFSLL